MSALKIFDAAIEEMSALKIFATAIEDCECADVKWLIENNIVSVDARLPCTFNLKTPALSFAVLQKQLPIIDILLRANANVNSVDGNDRTACHVAVSVDFYEALELLLSYGPNLGHVDVFGCTPLQLAFTKSNYERAALMLIKAGSPINQRTLLRCSELASTSMAAIQALLDRGVVVRDLVDERGATPLHYAAHRGFNVDILNMLVNNCGVDVDKPDCGGYSCIYEVAAEKNPEMLLWLINCGISIDASGNGDTPLHEVHDYASAIYLLAAGTNVHSLDMAGYTCLHRAVRYGGVFVVHALLGGGADLDIACCDGATARESLLARGLTVDPERVDIARRDIAKARLDFVRARAFQVCIGLHSLDLPALQMCEILQFSCGHLAYLICFHQWWKIATTIKHF